MGDDPESAETGDVLDDARRVPAERIGSPRQAEGQVVPSVGADLDPVQAEHSGPVGGDRRRTRSVAVVGQHQEVETGAACRGGDLGDRTTAVRLDAVDVKGASHHGGRAAGQPFVDVGAGRRRGGRDNAPEGGSDQKRRGQRKAADPPRRPRRRATGGWNQRPAAERRPAALSVRSHVNSGSLRPKCPNAAVFR